MTESTSVRPPQKRRWLKRLAVIVGGFFVLLVIAYFILTGEAFFKGVILPRVGAAMNASVTVEGASISPFSAILLSNLKVQTTGAEPLITAREVRARYSLWSILGGNIKVDEVALVSPTVQIIEGADGKSNLDPLLQSQKSGEKTKTSVPAKSSKSPQVDIKRILLENATIRSVQNHANGALDSKELSGVTITLDDLKNGQTGKLGLAADLKMDSTAPPPGTNASLQARLIGNFSFDLAADLQPSAIKGNTRLDVSKAGGALAELETFATTFDCEVTPTNIKNVALRFQKGGATLAEARVSGPFDMARSEGRLNLEVIGIDRQVLNLAGAATGMDFGSTTINSSNQIELTKGGAIIAVAGHLDVNKMTLKQKGQTTPTLDLQLGYNVTVNSAESVATLQSFSLSGAQNQKPFLRGDLTSPMHIAWGTSAAGAGDAALTFAVTSMNLADWKAFAGDAAPEGLVNANLKFASQQVGKQLAFDLTSQIDGLAAKFGSNRVQQATITLSARGQASDFKVFKLDDYRLQVAQQDASLISLNGSGSYDQTKDEADLQLAMEASLPKLTTLLAVPNVAISTGTVSLKARVIQKQSVQSVTGNLALPELTGQYGDYRFAKFGASADLDLAMKDHRLLIQKLAGSVREAANSGGTFDMTGNMDLVKNSGSVELKLVNLNENALRPFLAATLGDKTLVSVSIDSTVSARYDLAGDSSAKADFALSKLVVNDPKKQIPATPLEAKLKLDSSLKKQVLDLRQFQMTLTPTARAKNELQLTGTVDMTKSTAIQGALKLAADSLDATTYYDLFADKPQGKTNATQTGAHSTTTATMPPTVDAGTNVMVLPFQNFTFDASVGRFWLREMEITNWQTSLRIDGGHVVVKPLHLALNGAPVNGSANLDLGVPGFKYDVTFTADKIPIAPLANTFAPEYRGKASGDLLANVQISGIGTTGALLQKGLGGRLDLSFTNADIQLLSPRLKMFLTPVALALRAPEILETPLRWAALRSEIGSGKFNCQALNLVSPTFTLDTAGQMPISAVLTNSPFQKWPVHFYLKQSLAARLHMVPSGTPPDAAYAKLPQFLQVAGTLGTPKAEIDKKALLGTALEIIADKVPGLNEKTGGLLKGLGGAITGGKTATNAPADTNAPASPKARKPNLLDLIPKK